MAGQNLFPILIVDRDENIACVRLDAPCVERNKSFSIFVLYSAKAIYDPIGKAWIKNNLTSDVFSAVLRCADHLDDVPLATPVLIRGHETRFGRLPVAYRNAFGFHVGSKSD